MRTRGSLCLLAAGIQGGTVYNNSNGRLGQYNHYIEYDVELTDSHNNRGKNRLVVAVNGGSAVGNNNVRGIAHMQFSSTDPILAAWYTRDHYQNFIPLSLR
jgi:hypothetical protein